MTTNTTVCTAGAHWTRAWSEVYSTRVSVSDAVSRYETMPSPYRTETQLRGYLWQNDWRLGAHRLSAALERREDHIDNPHSMPGYQLGAQPAHRMGWPWATVSRQGTPCRPTCATTTTASSVARPRAAWRMAMGSPRLACHGLGGYGLPCAHVVPALQRIRRRHAAPRQPQRRDRRALCPGPQQLLGRGPTATASAT